MGKIESKTGNIGLEDEKIFNFLSDFNNFRNLIPADKIKNWESTQDSCKFTVDGIGDAGLRIMEREPNKLIKITSEGNTPIKFFLWIQIKAAGENTSHVRVLLEPQVNPLMMSMLQGPLQGFTDMLIDQLEKIKFT